jgi:hypothetical protein
MGRMTEWMFWIGLILLFAAGLLFGLAVAQAEAQNYDYGSPAELKGVVWIYVDVRDDPKWRQDIVEHIQEELPLLRLASSVADAEAVVYFTGREYSYYAGSTYHGSSSNAQYRRVMEGRGQILVLPDQGKPRLVFDSTSAARWIWDKRPSAKFAREFVKVYREANPVSPADTSERLPRSQRVQAAKAQAAEKARAAQPTISNPWNQAFLAMAPADRLAVFVAGLGSKGYACLGRSAESKGQDANGFAYWLVECEQDRFAIAIEPHIQGNFEIVSCRQTLGPEHAFCRPTR